MLVEYGSCSFRSQQRGNIVTAFFQECGGVRTDKHGAIIVFQEPTLFFSFR